MPTTRKTTTTRKSAPVESPAPTCADILADAPEGYASSANPEKGARALGMPNGKGFRRVMRDKLDLHVSEGTVWDDRARAFAYAYHTASGDKRADIAAACKRGDDVPPVETK